MAKKNRASARKRKEEREQEKQQQHYILLGAVVAMIVITGLIAFFSLQNAKGPEVAQDRLELDPYLGNPNAPVTITEYGAYGCEACRAWHEAGIVEQILEEFPNQVQFVYRDMPIIIPAWSQDMGEVAQCALDQSQDAFWTMHDALFHDTIQGSTSQSEAIEIGGNLGLDADALQACVDANTHVETVQYDRNRPEARGIRGTPTWFVNGQQVFNASPDVLRQMIRQALNG